MGIDLVLIPQRQPFGSWAGDDRLMLRRNEDLFEAIRAVPSRLVTGSAHFTPATHKGREVDCTDCYGQPLRYVFADDLAKIQEPEVLDGYTRACLAFVRALPDETPIVLWWC